LAAVSSEEEGVVVWKLEKIREVQLLPFEAEPMTQHPKVV
jgi:hypothetical protein